MLRPTTRRCATSITVSGATVAERQAVTIAVVYPDLLGTYGDGGNAAILARRLEWRGVAARVLQVTLGNPLPSSCDVYLLGGVEDPPQALAPEELRRGGSLRSAFAPGEAVRRAYRCPRGRRS